MAKDAGGVKSSCSTCCRTYPETNSMVACIFGTTRSAFSMRSKQLWKRNKKVAVKPWLRMRTVPPLAMEQGGALCASPSPLGGGRKTGCAHEYNTLRQRPCPSTAPSQRATPCSARPSREPHVAHGATSPLFTSCTHRGSGQECPATFLLRFQIGFAKSMP
jgi:hypothetical protein